MRPGLALTALLLSPLAAAEGIDWPVQSLLLADVPQLQELWAVQGQAGLELRNTSEGVQLDAPLALEVGLGRQLQVSAEVEWSRQREAGSLERGVSTVGLGVRYGLQDSADTGFALALELDAELSPTSGLGEDSRAVYGTLLAYKQLGRLGLNATVSPGLAYTREHELEPRLELGLGALWGSSAVVPMVELQAELGEESAVEAAAGLKLKLGDITELGAGVLVGRRGGEGVYGATASVLIDWED